MANAILGISAFYHDSAAAIVVDGRIIAAAQEERFTRSKFDERFPKNAIGYVLGEAGLTLDDVTLVSFYDKPFIRLERLLETYHAFAPRGLGSFITAMRAWVGDKLMMKRHLSRELSAFGSKVPRLLFPEHHLSHAASAFYPSPFPSAGILTIDGVGEWATTMIADGDGAAITVLKEQQFPHSLGLLYSAFTDYCGFRVNSGEYKLMGLAPYGDAGSAELARLSRKISTEMIDLREDGSFALNMDFFGFATGLTMCNERRWRTLFGVPRRQPESTIGQSHMNMALAIQRVCEEAVLRLARTTRELTGRRHLVLAGGVALNCVTNGRLSRAEIFDDIWVQPAAGDAGGALGAALAAWHVSLGKPRAPTKMLDAMQGSYLGPAFSARDVQRLAEKYGAPYERFESFAELCERVSALIDDGAVVGWFQGRMEFGPRALGNRSILGDARSASMQKHLNLKIKFREGFRPFAPAVLAGDAREYFELDRASPYMLLVAPVEGKRRCALPEGYAEWPLFEKLYFKRSDLPAVTHVDGSARIQTVHEETNPRFAQLLRAFKRRTGCGVIVNTSFNVRGEPIVCSPEDAYRCFMRTEMDWLVMEDFVFERRRQPELDLEKRALALD